MVEEVQASSSLNGDRNRPDSKTLRKIILLKMVQHYHSKSQCSRHTADDNDGGLLMMLSSVA